VWPHDNAIAAAGMSRYGEKESSARVLSALFDASMFVDRRMPELFCGFRRRSHEGPILYPVACAPQSWAAGAVFLLLQACLGIEIDAIRSRVIVDRPFLPKELDRVVLHGLELGDATFDVVFEREGPAVAVRFGNRTAAVDLVVV
jgi:glycogen debranching enzyme